jgi:hypothetical protein
MLYARLTGLWLHMEMDMGWWKDWFSFEFQFRFMHAIIIRRFCSGVIHVSIFFSLGFVCLIVAIVAIVSVMGRVGQRDERIEESRTMSIQG